MSKNIKRGQVWYYVPTVTPSGHIQKGPRPVVIVSNDRINETSDVVLAIPCTSQIKRNFPTHTLFILNKSVSVALAEQIMPINVNELTDLKATLENYIVDQIDDAIKISLGFKVIPSAQPSNSDSKNVNNCVENSNNSSTGSQVDKFYSRYPQLNKGKQSSKTKWTKKMRRQLVEDFESITASSIDLENKYGLSYETIRRYYYKFRTKR